jgi:hypothetical protein
VLGAEGDGQALRAAKQAISQSHCRIGKVSYAHSAKTGRAGQLAKPLGADTRQTR